MKENPIPMKMGGEAGLRIGIAEIVVGAVVDFAEKLIPDELKTKEKPVQSAPLEDLVKMAAIRSELGALKKEDRPQPEQRVQEPAVPRVMLTA